MKLKTIEYMADAIGVEICGELRRTPEFDGPGGECYTDEAGKQFLIDDLGILTVNDPNAKPSKEPQPIKKRQAVKVRPFPIPSYAVNRMETDRFGIPYKRANQIDETFRSERSTKWKQNRIYRDLNAEEEFALCAVSCRGAEKLGYAKEALTQINSKELLFTVTVAAAEKETQLSVLNRFQNDRTFLYAVRSYRPNDRKYQLIREQASELLKDAELKEVSVSDENALTEKLLKSEITEAFSEALEKISGGENLLKLMEAGFEKAKTELIVRRAQKTTQDGAFEREVLELILSESLSGKEASALYLIHQPDLLFTALEKGKRREVKDDAEKQIYDLYDRAEQNGELLPPLTNAQQDLLCSFYESRHSLRGCFGRKLLDPDKLLMLLEKRLDKGIETDEMIYSMQEMTFPETLLVKMFHAFGSKTQDTAKKGIYQLDSKQIKQIILQYEDWDLRRYAFPLLESRGEPIDDLLPWFDPVVHRMINSARTADGCDRTKICNVYRKIGPELAAHYGFSYKREEWENQDGETEIRDWVRFEGRSYLLYSS